MKTILVLTDFSEKAENAALYALKIAEKTHANIILFHSFEKFQSVNVPESGSWEYEDYDLVKNDSLTELQKLKDNIADHHKQGAFEPEINLLNELGIDLSSSVNGIVRFENVDLVVMGARGDDTFSHFFNGSDTYGVLDEAYCPVMFIPPTCRFEPFKTIVFANDLKKDYTKALGFLTDIARIDLSHIILTHFGENENGIDNCLNIIKNEFGYANVTSRLLPLENVNEQLQDFAEVAKAGLVAMIHHKGVRLERIISGSRSKNMLKHNDVPLLIFPD